MPGGKCRSFTNTPVEKTLLRYKALLLLLLLMMMMGMAVMAAAAVMIKLGEEPRA